MNKNLKKLEALQAFKTSGIFKDIQKELKNHQNEKIKLADKILISECQKHLNNAYSELTLAFSKLL